MAFRTPRDIDRRYTRKFKEIILNAPLIDTRALYKSIDVTAEIDYNFGTFMSSQYTFTVKIYAEPYLCYHIIPMQLLSWFKNSRSFNNTTQRYRQYFRAYLQNEYPLINFDNITFELGNIIIVNQPEGGGLYNFYLEG
jgi:hypothetical protein